MGWGFCLVKIKRESEYWWNAIWIYAKERDEWSNVWFVCGPGEGIQQSTKRSGLVGIEETWDRKMAGERSNGNVR